jgi:hypothetical protein
MCRLNTGQLYIYRQEMHRLSVVSIWDIFLERIPVKRKLNMKSILKILVLVVLFCVSACNTLLAATTEVKTSATPMPENDAAQPLVKTSMGDFVIVSARFADEVNGEKPASGEKILLVILSQPGLKRLDPGKFSLETFGNMTHDTSKGEIYILGDDGSKTISTMGGWVNEEFVMGFRVPERAKTYILFWQDNPPIDIVAEQTAR